MAKLIIIHEKGKSTQKIKGNYNKICEGLVEMGKNDDTFALMLRDAYKFLKTIRELNNENNLMG